MASEKQQKSGYILPEQLSGHDLLCLSMRVPDNPEYLAALYGALYTLSKWWTWEKKGDTSGTQAATYWRQLIDDYVTIGECESVVEPIAAGLAVGMVIPYAGELPLPDGLLLCDGATYDAVDYPELFTVIHSTYKGVDTFVVPDMRDRAVFGAFEGVGADAYQAFNASGGEREHDLTIDEIPEHTHTVAKRNATTLGSSSALAAGNNASGTLGSSDTGSTGGGLPHNNMPPYRNLWYVIVARSITGGEPREIVMDSELLPDGCRKIYWRYEDELEAANRYLATVCDGEQGEPGAPGADGVCPECEVEDGGVDLPEPTLEEIPEGQNERCLAAASMEQIIYDTMKKTHDESLLGAGLAGILAGIFTLITPFFPPAAFAAAGLALGSTVGAFITAGGMSLITEEIRDELRCLIYCLLDAQGRLTTVLFDELMEELTTRATTPFTPAWEFVKNTVFALQPEILNNVARLMVVREADCLDCACGNCYRYFGTGDAVVYPAFDAYMVSEPHGSFAAATIGTVNRVKAGQTIGGDETFDPTGISLKIDVLADQGVIIDNLSFAVQRTGGGAGDYVRVVNNANGAYIYNNTGTGNLDVDLVGVNLQSVTIQTRNAIAFHFIDRVQFTTIRPLGAPKVSNC